MTLDYSLLSRTIVKLLESGIEMKYGYRLHDDSHPKGLTCRNRQTGKKNEDHNKMLARAKNRYDAHEIMEMGITHIRKYTATRQRQRFIIYEDKAMK
jgi:hypothetical protein